MDVRTFADELLRSLSNIEFFERVALQTEGPVVSGYAYFDENNFFLRFYFNEVTGTIAFALVENQQRIWGIDYDNRRGWHLHPIEQPANHIQIDMLSISEIVVRLQRVLLSRK